MKYIIIGLGRFGASLAKKLTEIGHEVIGVDINPHVVEVLKDTMTNTICLNFIDGNALKVLPLKEADAVFVTIGNDFGSSINCIALLKQYGIKKIVARALSSIHRTVMEAIGVDEIILPEHEYAEMYAVNIEISGIKNSYIVDKDHIVTEIFVPHTFVGQTIKESDIATNFGLTLLGVKRAAIEKNVFNGSHENMKLLQHLDDQTLFIDKDILVLFGKLSNIIKFKQI